MFYFVKYVLCTVFYVMTSPPLCFDLYCLLSLLSSEGSQSYFNFTHSATFIYVTRGVSCIKYMFPLSKILNILWACEWLIWNTKLCNALHHVAQIYPDILQWDIWATWGISMLKTLERGQVFVASSHKTAFAWKMSIFSSKETENWKCGNAGQKSLLWQCIDTDAINQV